MTSSSNPVSEELHAELGVESPSSVDARGSAGAADGGGSRRERRRLPSNKPCGRCSRTKRRRPRRGRPSAPPVPVAAAAPYPRRRSTSGRRWRSSWRLSRRCRWPPSRCPRTTNGRLPSPRPRRASSSSRNWVIEDPDGDEIDLTTELKDADGQPASTAVAAGSEREWVALIESLRHDVERLRVERAEKPVQKPHTAAGAPGRAKAGKKAKPVQDEWGFFDPEQCGFAALLAKLDEVTEADEGRI